MGFRLRGGRQRVDSARESEIAKRLQDASEDGEYAGKPLSVQNSPFFLDTADYLRAAAGPPAWSRRLAQIQRLRSQLEEDLQIAWRDHARRFQGRPREFAVAWRIHLTGLDLAPLNDLIAKHNAYYPIEARLRMHWPSGRYILPDGMEHPQAAITPETLIDQFPADMTQAPE